MGDVYAEFVAKVSRARIPPRKFANAYAAGYDAGKSGPDTTNCHIGWFSSVNCTNEWQRGYDAAKASASGEGKGGKDE